MDRFIWAAPLIRQTSARLRETFIMTYRTRGRVHWIVYSNRIREVFIESAPATCDGWSRVACTHMICCAFVSDGRMDMRSEYA